MADVNTQGYQALGSALTGGGELPATMGYAQGELVGAKTQEAMLNAQAARDKAAAITQLQDPAFQQKIGVDSVTGNRWANMVAMGLKPEDAANAVAKDRDTQARAAIAAGTGGIAGQYNNAASVQPDIVKDRYQQLGSGNFADISGTTANPGAVYTSTVGQSEIGDKNADAALKTAEATNPSAFHPSSQIALTPEQAHALAVANHAGYNLPVGGRGAAAAAQVAGQLNDIDAAKGTTTGGFDVQGQHKATAAFAPGGTNSQQVQFVNRATGHLDIYDQLVDALNNGDVQLKNKAMNALKTQFGEQAPTNIDLAAPFVIGETMRSMAGANAGTLAEREPLAVQMGNTASPDQAHGAANTLRGMIKEQGLALQQQYKMTGKHDFTTAQLLPKTAAALGIQEADAAPAAAASTGALPPDIAALVAKHGGQ